MNGCAIARADTTLVGLEPKWYPVEMEAVTDGTNVLGMLAGIPIPVVVVEAEPPAKGELFGKAGEIAD